MTPHQLYLCKSIFDRIDSRFSFLETMEKRPDIPIGWKSDADEPFIVSYQELLSNRDLWINNILEADIVITGSAPDWLIAERLKKGKLTFRYSERVYKKKCKYYELPARAVKYFWKHGRHKNLYLLCASAFTAGDYAKTGTFLKKTFKWGYFPETKVYDVKNLMQRKQNTIPQLLWAGRFLDWKHPEHTVLLADELKQNGYSFTLNLIGTGEMEGQLRQMIDERGLSDCVHLLGSMKPEEVRAHMEQANIYLFTSDRGEGWGAVLNESMNSGCAVVASHEIGAVPFLLKEGENGLIYRSGDVRMLYEKVRYLLEHPEEQIRMGTAAYETIAQTWNAEVAAERLLVLAECLKTGKETPYQDGPCSRAMPLLDNWD